MRGETALGVRLAHYIYYLQVFLLLEFFLLLVRERNLVNLVNLFLLAGERDLVDLVDFFSCSAFRLAKSINLINYYARVASGFLTIILLLFLVVKNLFMIIPGQFLVIPV